MAAIRISVKNNLFSVETDQYEWTGLYIDGSSTSVPPDESGAYRYAQQTEGIFEFKATSEKTAVFFPDGKHFILKGTEKSHHLMLTYPAKNKPVIVRGLGANTSPQPDAEPGPFFFSQGSMTGVFEADKK